MVEQITPYLQTLLVALIGAVVTVLCVVIKKGGDQVAVYLESKLSGEQLATIKGYAQTSVRFLEQSPVFKDFDGAKKKEMAILDITQFCQKNKLPFDYQTIDKVVEEAVQIMNAELGKPLEDFLSEAAEPVSIPAPAETPTVTATAGNRYSPTGPVA